MNENNEIIKSILDDVTKAKAFLIALNSQMVFESEKDSLFENCFSELERIRTSIQNLKVEE